MLRTLGLLLASATTAIGIGLTAPPANADNFSLCPSGMSGVASYGTTCDFADNVRYPWYAQPGLTITAYSPVTGKTYKMQCAPEITDAWGESKRCVGEGSRSNILIVYIS
jgi:hypothetical protein